VLFHRSPQRPAATATRITADPKATGTTVNKPAADPAPADRGGATEVDTFLRMNAVAAVTQPAARVSRAPIPDLPAPRPSRLRKNGKTASFRGPSGARQPGNHEYSLAKSMAWPVFLNSGPGPKGPSRNDRRVFPYPARRCCRRRSAFGNDHRHFRRMAHCLNAMAIRIADERTVVIGMVVRPKPRRPIIAPTGCQRRGVKRAHLRPIGCTEAEMSAGSRGS
jgi:hypothetical protein